MPPATILVVDDARDIRDFIAEVVLQPNGYRVLQADSGAAGLEIAYREHPDLIISDIKMPGVTGLDLARAVQREWPQLPVILITAEGSEEIAQQALRAGVVDYFIKPFDPEELLQTIQRALARPNAASAAQEEHARQLAAARAEYGQLYAVLNEIQDGAIILDLQERLILINHAARRLLGLEGVIEVGTPLAAVVAQPDLVSLVTQITPLAELGLADGRTLSVQVTQIAGVGRSILLHDITHLKEMDRIKSEFVTTVSHDLRSPLTAILGYVSLLDRVGPLNERQADFVVQVRKSVQSMNTLLTDLLDLGRIEAGFDTQREPVHLSGLIHRTVEAYQPQAHTRSQILLIRVSPNLPLVLVNSARIRQMLSNLIDNALKYTPDRGQVSVDVYAEGDFVVLTVADSGMGIPAADQPYIFDKFFRAGNVRSDFAGTGLGLSIVKSIVDQHGGRIWVDSQPEHGTTFTVMLPQYITAPRE